MTITENFYRQLLKVLYLCEREKISKSLLVASRDQLSERWAAIKATQNKFTKPLNNLTKNGYLKILWDDSKNLTKSLCDLWPIQNYHNSQEKHDGEIKYLSGIEELPEVKKLIADQSLINLVSLYLGAPVQVYKVLAWWQFPMRSSQKLNNAQLWHRDRDDFLFLKLFLYCTDVDEESGPILFYPKRINL